MTPKDQLGQLGLVCCVSQHSRPGAPETWEGQQGSSSSIKKQAHRPSGRGSRLPSPPPPHDAHAAACWKDWRASFQSHPGRSNWSYHRLISLKYSTRLVINTVLVTSCATGHWLA